MRACIAASPQDIAAFWGCSIPLFPLLDDTSVLVLAGFIVGVEVSSGALVVSTGPRFGVFAAFLGDGEPVLPVPLRLRGLGVGLTSSLSPFCVRAHRRCFARFRALVPLGLLSRPYLGRKSVMTMQGCRSAPTETKKQGSITRSLDVE